MDKYLGIYSSSGDVQTALNNGELNKPYVALVNNQIDFNTVENEPDYSQIPLTFEILSDGDISWTSIYTDVTIEYKKNDGEWTSITSSNSGGGDDSSSSSSSSDSGSGGGSVTGTLIPVLIGDTVQFRGTDHLTGNASFQGTNVQFNAYGNINSLITTGYASNPESFVLSASEYNGLFKNCTGLTSAENLVLPATTLVSSCYANLFYGCSSLNYIKCLATDISAGNCTFWWIYGVAATGTFVKKTGVNWETNPSGIPSGWTVVEE